MKPVDYVIMACAALILLLLAVFLLPGGPSQAALDNAFAKTCETFRQNGCSADGVISMDALTSGRTTYTLGNLCALRGLSSTVECANSCGCDASGGGTVLSETPTVAYSDNPYTVEVITDEQLPEDNITTEEYYGI